MLLYRASLCGKIILFSERKMIDKNSCEWSFNTIVPANSMLKQYDTVGHILFYFLRLQKSYVIATVLCA